MPEALDARRLASLESREFLLQIGDLLLNVGDLFLDSLIVGLIGPRDRREQKEQRGQNAERRPTAGTEGRVHGVTRDGVQWAAG